MCLGFHWAAYTDNDYCGLHVRWMAGSCSHYWMWTGPSPLNVLWLWSDKQRLCMVFVLGLFDFWLGQRNWLQWWLGDAVPSRHAVAAPFISPSSNHVSSINIEMHQSSPIKKGDYFFPPHRSRPVHRRVVIFQWRKTQDLGRKIQKDLSHFPVSTQNELAGW